MRPVDADEVERAFIGNRYGTKAIKYMIDAVPTVKAIPVEWIERKINESLHDRYARWEDIAAQADTDTMMKSWAILIERWEKENE